MTLTDPDRPVAGSSVPGRHGHPRLARIAGRISGAIRAAGDGPATVVRRAPRFMRATRTAAVGTTSALQVLSDPTLRSIAASSLGLGAGFYIGGAPRLTVAASLSPALVMGAAVVLRPIHSPSAGEARG